MKSKFRYLFFKALGLYQIACGIWGIHTLVLSLTLLNFLFLLPFLLLLLISGIYIFFKLNNQSYYLTFYNQLLQIVQFKFFGNGFMYASGIYFSVGLDAWDISNLFIDYRYWTFIGYLFINSHATDFYLTLNFIPILILLFMILSKRLLRNPDNEG